MAREDRRQPAYQIRIGVFILVSLAVFLGLVYLLGAQARLFEPKYNLVAEFTEVGGLISGATVRLAGVQIGRVSRVTLPEAPGQKVRVTLTIARRFGDRIRKDSVARIETQGLLGDKLVEISLGSAGAPALKPGEAIVTRDPVELARLAGESVEILKNVSGLSANLNSAVEAFNKAGTLENLSATLRSTHRAAEQVGRVTEQVEKGKGWLHALVYEEPEALRQLHALLARTERLLTQAERGEHAVSVLLSAESGRAARRLLEAVDALSQMTEKAKSSESLLAALLLDPRYKGVLDDLQALARNFREVSERLAQGKGVAGALLRDDGEGPLGEATQDFKVAVANLRAITDRLRAGEGTLGGLLEDPTVYENLAAFLEGAQRSAILRYLIRSTIQKGVK
ncbi:MAG: MCE family protein [Candidatus Rokubacteria bacterium]|nr:MCE family protein [Candidatus Rokubacteria bacterium]